MIEDNKDNNQHPPPAGCPPVGGEAPVKQADQDGGTGGTKGDLVRRGRAVAERKISLAGQRLSHGAKSLKASAGPLAARSAEVVKHQSAQSAEKLRQLQAQRAAPALARFSGWLRERLHPRSILRDYKSFQLFIHNRILDWNIDALFFVPTRGRVSPVSLSIPSQVRGTCHDYRPTPSRLFKWAMLALPESLEDRAFVDFGAGRGRVLLLASQYPFDKIRGAEIAGELHDECILNIAQYPRSPMKCRDVECARVRATTLSIPDQPTVFYFFDPFDDSVLEKVLARITRSYARNRRELHLICIDMDEENIVEAQGIFQPVPFALKERMKIAAFSPYSIRVYKTEP